MSSTNTKSSESTGLSFFESNSQVIVPHVMEFLGIKSLLRLAATSKQDAAFLSQEVARRKKRVAECEQQVKELLSPTTTPSRADVAKAHALCEEAKGWIDAEIGRAALTAPSFDMEEEDNFEDPLFPEERCKVTPCPYGEQPALVMLPDCFYIPPTGEARESTKKGVDAMSERAIWLWGAEDHMSMFYETEGFAPYYNDPKYPFRKFEADSAQFFYECLQDVISQIRASPKRKEAFRVAARKLATRTCGATDCLHYVLHHADEKKKKATKRARKN